MAVQRPNGLEERVTWETPYSEGCVTRSTGCNRAM